MEFFLYQSDAPQGLQARDIHWGKGLLLLQGFSKNLAIRGHSPVVIAREKGTERKSRREEKRKSCKKKKEMCTHEVHPGKD